MHTSWTAPDESYEAAVHRLVDLMLGDTGCAALIARDVRPFAWYGALSSLSLTALKLTVPGVPDIYQGSSILDDSLVDPDNRRPVDFAQRQALIEELAALDDEPAGVLQGILSGWLAGGDFDRLKLWTIHRLLRWRARHPLVFEAGTYVPVAVTGGLARHCIAYARCHGDGGILVLVTRLYRQLGFPGPDTATDDPTRGLPVTRTAAPGATWGDAAVDLAAAGIRGHRFADLLTGSAEPAEPGVSSLPLNRLLGTLPLAVLAFDLGA